MGDKPWKQWREDLLWFAGLLEGEGYFGRANQTVRLDLWMTDLDVVERASRFVGSKVYHRKLRCSMRKPSYGFTLTGPKAASWMMTLYSLLGKRRRHQIAYSLLEWQKLRAKTSRKWTTANWLRVYAGLKPLDRYGRERTSA